MILALDLAPIRTAVAAALSEGAESISIRALLTELAERQNLPI